VDIFVCYMDMFACFFLFVRLRISPARIKLAASIFARWFRGVLGRESPTLGTLLPQSPKSDESASHREVVQHLCIYGLYRRKVQRYRGAVHMLCTCYFIIFYY